MKEADDSFWLYKIYHYDIFQQTKSMVLIEMIF